MSRDKAKKLLELIVVDKRKRPTYLSKNMLSSEELILTSGEKIKSTYEKFWLGFIDEQPQSKWSHKCKYVFIHGDTGKFYELKQKWPLKDANNLLDII
ncbi:hypothetical protein COV11_00395 [Candidatus Woesearchaeota archaeon CG10_big_fil_rev_8_21_14_0_10_30_7]|nr:MAG: hypothetical protein COV11_00395 [Candidatus Woesearchaeota archaeon CG10_big_fil_rev_8_21_14_0_10_30_7]